MTRGEIYYCNDAVTTGDVIWSENRPCIVVSDNHLAATSSAVEVVFLTTQPKRPFPSHVPIRATGRPSIALCEQICTLPKASLGDYIGALPPEEMAALEVGMIASLGMGARLDFAEPAEPADATPAELEAQAEIARLHAQL